MSNLSSSPVFDRYLSPILTPEISRQILDLRPDPQTQARLDELREKANEGQLSPEERVEYEEFVEGMDLVGFLKLKAKKVLGGPTS